MEISLIKTGAPVSVRLNKMLYARVKFMMFQSASTSETFPSLSTM
jgi:hypothetical protein